LYNADVKVPKFTTDIMTARDWTYLPSHPVVFCRTKLRSSQGRGIVIAKREAELVRAPLYTKQVLKDKEYRVHVFQGKVINIAQKMLRRGAVHNPEHNEFVRSWNNGWIFAYEGIVCPDNAKTEAVKAVAALGLDFGAVDIALTKRGNAVIFEVNTAPALEHSKTIAAYVEAFKNYKKKEEEEQHEENNRVPQR
jgi:glutathione synthase/RimK-type ligase-like ATP-grasp enzyme